MRLLCEESLNESLKMSEADCSLVMPHLKQMAFQTSHSQACGLGEDTHRTVPYWLILREEKVIAGRWVFAGFSAVTETADTRADKKSRLAETQKWVSMWLFLLQADCSFRMSKRQNQQELLHKDMHNKICQVPFMGKFNLCTWISCSSSVFAFPRGLAAGSLSAFFKTLNCIIAMGQFSLTLWSFTRIYTLVLTRLFIKTK